MTRKHSPLVEVEPIRGGPPPYDDIDPGVRDVVRLLNGCGIETVASCDGHGQQAAWVRMSPVDAELGDARAVSPRVVAWILHRSGYRGFTVSDRLICLSPSRAQRCIDVEFWAPGPPAPEAQP